MNKMARLLVLLLALGAPARAADEPAQTVAGFRVPEYDENSQLKSQLFGDFAKVLPDGVIEIFLNATYRVLFAHAFTIACIMNTVMQALSQRRGLQPACFRRLPSPADAARPTRNVRPNAKGK